MPKKKRYKNSAHRSYARRLMFLQASGHDSYKKYLNSDEWKQVRSDVFEKRGHHCVFCKSIHKIQAHHLVYHKSHFKEKDIRDIIPVCFECHSEITKIREDEQTNDFRATEIFRDRYYPNQNFSGGNKNKKYNIKLRVLSTRIVKRSGLPETLHHSLHAYGYKWRHIGSEAFILWYESSKSKYDPKMYEIYCQYKKEFKSFLENELLS